LKPLEKQEWIRSKKKRKEKKAVKKKKLQNFVKEELIVTKWRKLK